MRIAWQDLYRLPVVTESGKQIGLVEGVEIDVEGHSVTRYQVKPGRSLLSIFSHSLLIAPAEVVSISKETMVVKDALVPLSANQQTAKTRLALATPESEMKLRHLDEEKPNP